MKISAIKAKALAAEGNKKREQEDDRKYRLYIRYIYETISQRAANGYTSVSSKDNQFTFKILLDRTYITDIEDEFRTQGYSIESVFDETSQSIFVSISWE